jgi:hypothetical protein
VYEKDNSPPLSLAGLTPLNKNNLGINEMVCINFHNGVLIKEVKTGTLVDDAIIVNASNILNSKFCLILNQQVILVIISEVEYKGNKYFVCLHALLRRKNERYADSPEDHIGISLREKPFSSIEEYQSFRWAADKLSFPSTIRIFYPLPVKDTHQEKLRK